MKIHIYSLLAVLALSACSGGDVRSTLGLNRSAPDEFKVVSRPPLSVPPEFTLQPPIPGAPPRVNGNREKQAEALILRQDDEDNTIQTLGDMAPKSVNTALDPVISSSLETSGEASFLSNAGVEKADKNIRVLIYEERATAPAVDDNASPLERWLGLSEESAVVDAEAESVRIKDNIDQDKPLNEGEVKTIDSENDSVLDKLF